MTVHDSTCLIIFGVRNREEVCLRTAVVCLRRAFCHGRSSRADSQSKLSPTIRTVHRSTQQFKAKAAFAPAGVHRSLLSNIRPEPWGLVFVVLRPVRPLLRRTEIAGRSGHHRKAHELAFPTLPAQDHVPGLACCSKCRSAGICHRPATGNATLLELQLPC